MAYSQYNKQTWVDLPSTTTPISAVRLQYLEDALSAASTQLIALLGQISSLAAGGTVTNPGTGTTTDTTAPTINSFAATPGTTPGTVVLTWTASDNVAVTRSVVTRSGTTRYDGNLRTFTDTGLTGGTAYNWTLTVYDAAGNTKTATATATPTTATTTTARVLIGTPTISGASVVIPWTTTLGTDGVIPDGVTDGRDGVDSTGYGAYTATGDPINGSRTFGNLVPGSTYNFTVQLTRGGVNYGTPAVLTLNIPNNADVTAPTMPGNFTVTATTTTSITVSWTASTDAVGVASYRMYLGTIGLTTVDATARSYTYTGLQAGNSYSLGVSGVDAAGNVGSAATLTASTSAASTGGTTTITTLPNQVSKTALSGTTPGGRTVQRFEVVTETGQSAGTRQAFVYLAATQALGTAQKAIILHHGADDTGTGMVEGSGGSSVLALVQRLIDAGYVVISPSYSNTGGNAEAQTRIARAYSYLTTNWSITGAAYHGFSMGGGAVLGALARGTTPIKVAYVVAPLTDYVLATSVTYGANIFYAAYNTNASGIAAATAPFSPMAQAASKYAGTRIRMNVSSGDTTVPESGYQIPFRNLAQQTAADLVYVNTSGEHNATTEWESAATVVTWLNAAIAAAPVSGGSTGGGTPTTGALATESFAGTSGATWPTQWTTLSGSGGAVTQDGAGRGRLVSSATSYTYGNWALLSSVTGKTDLDVTLDVTFPVIAEEYLNIELRATAPASATAVSNNSYFLQLYPGNGTNTMGVYARSGGNETDLSGDLAAGAWTANTARRIRFQAVGTTVAVKIWAPTATEPSTWTWAGSSSAIGGATGSLLLTARSGSAATARTALVSNVTLSTGTTAATVSAGGGAGAGGQTGGGTVVSTMPTGDLTGWKYVGGQDFTTNAALGQVGSVYGQDVRGYDNFNDTSKNGLYAPDKVLTVANSALTARLHTESGQALVACPIPFGYGGQLYGRYSTRLRVDSGSGYKIAFLLWPSSDSWNDGEVDFPEMDLSSGSTIGGFSHDVNGNPSANAWSMGTNVTLADWHVCTIEWTPSKLTYLVDGVAQSTTTSAAIPKKPMRWTLQCETQLGGGAPSSSSVATVYIDWVAQWSYTG